jgi:hypothetical protein
MMHPTRPVGVGSETNCSANNWSVWVLSPPLADTRATTLTSQRGDGRFDRAEVLLVLEVDLVPRRVAEEDGEAAGPADYRRPYSTYQDAFGAARALFFFSITWGFE